MSAPGPSARLTGMRKTTSTLFAALALGTTMSVAGCGADAICGGDDYPVTAVGSTGRTCVGAGHEPPAGYARYPAGKVPKHVGDEWDVYWHSHTIDKSGAVVPA
jgi:hypothetical protein